ncbi:MAG: hypothetical protein AB2A00_22455 [Myxococcota bacterium]
MNIRYLLAAACLLTVLVACMSLLERTHLVASSPGSDLPDTPDVPPPPTGIVMRPDSAVYSFGLSLESKGGGGPELLRPAVEKLVQRARAAGAPRVEVQLRRAEVMSPNSDESERTLEVGGVLELELPRDGDVWARAAMINAFESGVRAQEREERRRQPSFQVALSGPEFRVRDPESARAELVRKWMSRVEALGTTTSGPTALRLVSCAPLGAITQSYASLDQVQLDVAVLCPGEAREF